LNATEKLNSLRSERYFLRATMAAAAGAEAPLCDYELQRLERIKRNRKARRPLRQPERTRADNSVFAQTCAAPASRLRWRR
jgi:hypothetical protein